MAHQELFATRPTQTLLHIACCGKQRRELAGNLSGGRNHGVTVLMVEPNAKKALSISDHAIVMDLGRQRFEGTGEEILHDPQVQRAYLGG